MGNLSSEAHIWACALTVERQHGERAPVFVAERIGALALAATARVSQPGPASRPAAIVWIGRGIARNQAGAGFCDRHHLGKE